MSSIVLNFAHANGFPSKTYRQFFAALPDNYSIIAKDMYGHEPKFPVSNNWQNQINEMIEFVENNSDAPVYAVGHSFGAALSLQACCTRPDLFKGLIMMEPPAFTGWKSYGIRFMKWAGLTSRYTPAGKAETRKQVWHKDEDVHAYFRGKPLFKQFTDESLNDYVQAGILSEDNEKRLAFKASVEADIFHSVPHNLHHLKGKLTVPATLVTATEGGVLSPAMVSSLLRLFPMQHRQFRRGGHLFPLEQPVHAAKLLVELIDKMETNRAD